MIWIVKRVLAGFLTRELREHGQRVGFEAIGLGGQRAILAHVRYRTLVSVGRYGALPDRSGRMSGTETSWPYTVIDSRLSIIPRASHQDS